MTTKPERTAACGPNEARQRLSQARDFIELAELADSANACIANAVLAGIAASDAACCSALGIMSRGQDHRQAVSIVARVLPGGADASKRLQRLLSLKEASHYGASPLGESDRRSALRNAASIVEFAESRVAPAQSPDSDS